MEGIIQSFGRTWRTPVLEELKTIVYIAVNRVNGKRYIGMTTRGLQYRKSGHASQAKAGGNSYIGKAIRKHGPHNFDFSILEVCRDQRSCLDREREIIAELKPEYNTAAGGLTGPQGWKHSEETRLYLSSIKIGKPGARIGSKLSAESIAKRTESRSKNPVRYWLGKKRSPETVAKIIASRALLPPPRPTTDKEKQFKRELCARNTKVLSRPIICLNDSIKFESCVHASRYYGISKSAIRRCCNGENVKAKGGLRFEYIRRDF